MYFMTSSQNDINLGLQEELQPTRAERGVAAVKWWNEAEQQ